MSILTSADRFRYEYEALINAEIERLKEALSLGFTENFEQYKYMAGRIAGLRSALELLDRAEAVCRGEEGK